MRTRIYPSFILLCLVIFAGNAVSASERDIEFKCPGPDCPGKTANKPEVKEEGKKIEVKKEEKKIEVKKEEKKDEMKK